MRDTASHDAPHAAPLDDGALLAPLDDGALLALWERALHAGAWQREDLLVDAASAGRPAQAPRTPGARNVALLRWRRAFAGRALPLRASCPRCAGELDLVLDTDTLCDAHRDAPADGVACEAAGRRIELRAPTIDDLRELSARHADVDTLAEALLRRCVVSHDGAAPFDATQRGTIAMRLEALDPCARLDIALACPDCGHAWSTALDVAAVLWAELRRRAEQLLVDIATLAREYGWSERELLRMSPARRAAYLQLAGAA